VCVCVWCGVCECVCVCFMLLIQYLLFSYTTLAEFFISDENSVLCAVRVEFVLFRSKSILKSYKYFSGEKILKSLKFSSVINRENFSS